MRYTKKEKILVDHTRKKVEAFFKTGKDKAHGIDHVNRVTAWAVEIGKKERARSVCMCEMGALLHDIGRVPESKLRGKKAWRKHHELSYTVLKDWFKKDRVFDALRKKQKIELLYTVRYHWNNAANRFDTAWIVRDADKLDMIGKEGLKRALEFFKNDEAGLNQNMRNIYDSYCWIRTSTARKIVKKNKMMKPIEEYYVKLLKAHIEPVSLD